MGGEERRRGYIPRGRIKITSPSGRVQTGRGGRSGDSILRNTMRCRTDGMHHPVTACSIPSSWSDPEEARLARRRFAAAPNGIPSS